MRDELTVALFDSALVATRGDSGLLGRWLTLAGESRWLATRGDSALRSPRRGDSARRAVWRGRGLGGKKNVMEVLLNKFIWMRKILIMIIVMF